MATDTILINQLYVTNKKEEDFTIALENEKFGANRLRDLTTHVYKCKPTNYSKKDYYKYIFDKLQEMIKDDRFAKYFTSPTNST